MKDLTEGPIRVHLLRMAAPIAGGLIAQMAYQIVDVYFVSKLGATATAGLVAASNIVFVVAAASQVLAIGVGGLIAQALGRRDGADAKLVFNQSLALSSACGLVLMVALYGMGHSYLYSVVSDRATLHAGITFLFWVLPGYALALPTSVLSAALRGAGIVTPTVVLYAFTVVINVCLAPILINGWITGVPLGVGGAGLATTISTAIGLILFTAYFRRSQHEMTLDRASIIPRLHEWRRVLAVGLPGGGDLALFFAYNAVIYYAIRNHGADTQAGFGIGSRVLQTVVLPGIAICFAAAPIAGQNYGASRGGRVQETFHVALALGVVCMIVTTMIVQWQATALVGFFGAGPSVVADARIFLQLSSWSLVGQAVVTTCSSIFQGLGNTIPSMISSGVRLLTFSVPVIWLSNQSTFRVEEIWYLSVATLMLQAGVSLCLLRTEFRKRLSGCQGDGTSRSNVVR